MSRRIFLLRTVVILLPVIAPGLTVDLGPGLDRTALSLAILGPELGPDTPSHCFPEAVGAGLEVETGIMAEIATGRRRDTEGLPRPPLRLPPREPLPFLRKRRNSAGIDAISSI